MPARPVRREAGRATAVAVQVALGQRGWRRGVLVEASGSGSADRHPVRRRERVWARQAWVAVQAPPGCRLWAAVLRAPPWEAADRASAALANQAR